MSSTEEYLDSLLRSVMSGKKPPAPIEPPTEEENAQTAAEPAPAPIAEPEPAPAEEPIAAPAVEEPVVNPEPAPSLEDVAIGGDTTAAPVMEEIPVMEETAMPAMDDVPPMPEEKPAPREHVSFIGTIMSEIPATDRSGETEEPAAPSEADALELAAEATYIMPEEAEMPAGEAETETPDLASMAMSMMEAETAAEPEMPEMEMPVMDEPIMDMPEMPEMAMPEMAEMGEMAMPEMADMGEMAMPEMAEMGDLMTDMPMPEMEMPVMDEPIMDMPEMTEMADMGEMAMPEMGDLMTDIPAMEAEAEMPMPEMEMPVMDEPIMDMPEMPEMADMGEMAMPEMPEMEAMPEMETPEAAEGSDMLEMPELFMVDIPGMEGGETAEQLPDEDISKLLQSIEEMDSPLDEPAQTEDAAEAPESAEEMPVMDEMPMMDEMPIMDEAPMEGAEEAALADDLSTSMDDLLGLSEENLDSALQEAAAGDIPLDSMEELGLEDLLTGSEGDAELTEIGDLLSADNNNEAVDASILETDVDELTPEQLYDIDEALDEDALEEEGGKKRKKKKKKEKKPRKDKAADGEQGEEGEKKPGFFAKILDSLTKEVEEEEAATEESGQIFEETAKDIAIETAAENQKIIEEMGDEEEEGEAKGKKGKKAKKEKKPKEKKQKVKKEVFPDDPSLYRKLPRKNVIVICILCFSLGVVITLLTYLLPYYRDTKKAQSAYDHGNYIEAYTDLKGHNLNKKQQEIYNKSVVILKEKRKLDSYEKYMQLNMPAQALDALLQGLKNADDFGAYAEELGVKDTFDEYTREIESKVTGTFGLDLGTAYEWSKIEDANEYSRQIYQFLSGNGGGSRPVSDMTENPVIAGEEEEFAE
ncbi:MAG: hypothetical protein J5518_08550 [Lachnospiraceae bacterium]|nr:hypothetical protein [Lachnospiraceae bacterium]